MNNPIIQTDIAEILRDLQKGQQNIIQDIADIKINLEEFKGEMRTSQARLEERLEAQESIVTELKDTQKTLVEDVNSLKGVKSFIIPLIVAVTTTILTLLVRSIPAP